MVEIDNAGITKIILFAYPVIIGQGVILLESLRILPAEFRIWRRAVKRRRFNAAETMFLVIKYFAIIGYVLDAIFRTTTLLRSDRQCYLTHYISTFFILFDTSLVALAIAWRTYIIFRCNRNVYWILSIALAGQLALSMWAMTRVLKSNVLVDGYCDFDYPDSRYDIPRMKLALPYYLMYNALYDLLVTAAATRHLVKSTGASFGVSEISRVLFYNNIHYVLVVCTVNLTEAFLLYAAPRGVPSMMHISCAIQIITAMNLLAIEQDLVHGPTTQRVSHAPHSALKSDPTNSSSSLGKNAFSPSTLTSHSWQTNSKQQTATFQSEASNVGSPLLHSLWHKKARADADTAATAATSLKTHQPGISFEQKKMHFYDDYMSDVEKQEEYSPGLSAASYGSPRRDTSGQAYNTFIIANPDTPNGPQVYQLSSDSNNMMMSTPFNKTSTSSMEVTCNPQTDSPTTKRPTTSGTTGGISIRSIRANMESASNDGSMNMSPLHKLHRPSTSPTTASPLTPLSEAKKRLSRIFDTQKDWQPPTFEISPGKGPSGCPRAMVDPSTPPRKGDALHRTESKASLSSIKTFTSQSALHPTLQRVEPTLPKPRSNNNLSTALIDREATPFVDDSSKSERSGGDFSSSTFGRHAPAHRVNSLELDDDPFRS